MTRQEAIRILRQTAACLGAACGPCEYEGECIKITTEKFKEAVKMALNSLEIDDKYNLLYEETTNKEAADHEQSEKV